MIRIVALSNPRLAQAFIDYMHTHQVRLVARINGNDVDIWLPDESQQERVKQELARFLQEPWHERYQAASWQNGTTDSGLRYPSFSYLQTLRQRAGPLTLGVLVVAIAVYLLMQAYGVERMMALLAFPDSVQTPQLWRWFSHALLHFSLLHLLFNLMWWWYLGGPVERVLGTRRLCVILLLSSAFSGWVQSWFSGVYFGGLSGVVYALMGYVWLRGEREPDGSLHLQRGLMAFALVWLVVGYFDILGMSIANAAHIAGLVIGLLMAWWDTRNRRR
ncbi:Rhomboid protease GlpG [Dickeya dianthicola]|uniref:Rhomboid protease GlpG n=1 Tax=Dickeya dianthicola TaxID=204039 RepID=A0ABX9NKP9_9GAMM|nr:rhomboid family intramembrane serine protease GlpG [Dickeya dianthicola]ATO35104.1 GlpG protein (membrane protein of glp regulon) [Dickeya dianthicola RNS04.9]AYC20908.1 Rhomboid protease GlpG [Dickeya dianthicola]MBI0438637.1 rhomboid family intramembrane serine protease GlpG [Dickeya dianthicola]MBI0449516.1 rhomboid family intramembrane serine protease GlpG [Dickeya dianthicola]MBI0453435.1 rhomboid family intramembrane serine protease GlpG [Dickeya dianthicola]